jgi:hypothetical protein
MELLLGFMGVSLLLHIYYINRMRVLRDWIEIVDNRIDYYEKNFRMKRVLCKESIDV